MRKIRGIKRLVDYLESINCPMSVSTIQRLMRSDEIPYSRPAPRVIIFDLDLIDKWLGVEEGASYQKTT